MFLLFGLFSLFLPIHIALGNNSTNIPITDQETLGFIVRHSDLIAIVEFDQDAKGSILLTFFNISDPILARVANVIKGTERLNTIKIYSETKFPAPGALKNKVIFRRGRHLVFLCKADNGYRPTTRFSVLDISNDRVYPIWKQNNNGEFQYGYPLEDIIYDINKIN